MGAGKTDARLVQDANELARQFYLRMGYTVGLGYRFDRATHPQELACWRMAVDAYEHVNGTDIITALAGLDEA